MAWWRLAQLAWHQICQCRPTFTPQVSCQVCCANMINFGELHYRCEGAPLAWPHIGFSYLKCVKCSRDLRPSSTTHCTKRWYAISHIAYSKACRIPTTLPTGVAFGTCRSGLWLSNNYACSVVCAQGYVADASTARQNFFLCQNGKFVATPQLVCKLPVKSMRFTVVTNLRLKCHAE